MNCPKGCGHITNNYHYSEALTCDYCKNCEVCGKCAVDKEWVDSDGHKRHNIFSGHYKRDSFLCTDCCTGCQMHGICYCAAPYNR